MKSIYQLIPDVEEVLKNDSWLTEELADDFRQRLIKSLVREEQIPRLRLSQLGPKCPCELWHSIHHSELAEPLPPWAKFKYSYGYIIEALAITLAKAAGHTVEGEQDVIYVDGIKGSRDCVIDGCVVDVKSASSRGFQKFRDKSIAQSDSFGYLDQIDGYVVGSRDDPLVIKKDRGFLWAIDKQLGHMTLYEHSVREEHLRERIRYYKEIVGCSSSPACECKTVAHGASGNIKLDIKASYNRYKHCCFPNNIRTFIYSDGPVYLTKVVRVPDVKEVDKNGKVVFN